MSGTSDSVSSDVILEVRTSKMKKMPGLQIESGIDKGLRDGAVHVGRLGISEDEHDLTFHGGPDKAVHGYCCSHYPDWQEEYPSAADRFTNGGFGENFVLKHMNERSVCIGDIYAIGGEGGPVLQVSLPRQPCYKLNHRFHLKNFAPQTWRSSRTGWYYRVIKEGNVQAGDTIKLIERRHPKWTIQQVQEYLHRNPNEDDMNKELSEVEELGEESRGAFRKRVAQAKAREKREKDGRLKEELWRDFKIVEKKKQTDRIVSLVLEAVTPGTEAEKLPKGGLHAKLLLPNGLKRSYSLVSGDRDRFELGIALEPDSRGGSRLLHDQEPNGTAIIKVGKITSDVEVAKAASHHVFIAGGIGITAFLSMMESYKTVNFSEHLHYAVRSLEDVPFRERLDGLGDGIVRIYDKSKGERLDIDAIVGSLKWNSQLYVCGPSRMMEAARRAVKAHGLEESEVHFEAFEAVTSGDPFEAEVSNRDKKVVKVGEEETLLEVLRREFGTEQVDSSCEVGNCGTCKVRVRAGQIEHRGTALLAEERSEAMLSCVSRGVGRIAIDI